MNLVAQKKSYQRHSSCEEHEHGCHDNINWQSDTAVSLTVHSSVTVHHVLILQTRANGQQSTEQTFAASAAAAAAQLPPGESPELQQLLVLNPPGQAQAVSTVAGAGDLTGDAFGYGTGVLAVIIHASK